jgi:threonine synthase
MTSSRYQLVCPECGTTFDPEKPQTFCTACASPILAKYDPDRVLITQDEVSARPRGIWRWRELLPVNAEEFRLVLGEGDSPLLPVGNLAKKFDLPGLYIKDESSQVTGSFKARGMAVAISKAIELGLREFVIPTAGNAGGALAAYAARAGCAAHVFMPADTPMANQVEVRMAGAELILVDGLINDAAKLAREAAIRHGWFDVSTFKEPFRVEGKKTMGFELAEAFNWQLPDVIVYPTGGGTGLVGMWKAFSELEALGWIDSRRPRMVSVQAEGCAPVVRAFQTGAIRCEVWQNAATIASGLRVPAVFADRLILRTLRESRGIALTVTDAEILAAQKELAASEGVFAAPEGAATVAALSHLIATRWLQSGDKVVLFNTGSGLKYVSQ